ncbi:MAG: uracil-DNA glycosylase [Burkholderiales bacterium]|nr:uracil-DNA glycosylase [Burkholderiales bacterium]
MFDTARPAHWLSAQFDAVPPSWRDQTEAFRQTAQGQQLVQRVESAGEVYPGEVFAALHLTALPDVRVVILGQDPYHGPGQAHGLAFSVQKGVAIPPSLRNIRKELTRDLGLVPPEHGCLQAWAQRGVLLLNTVLTVSPGQAASHAAWGWETLTDRLIAAVAARSQPAVFMLWGAHAQKKRPLIEAAAGEARHLILQANHPSPLSATRGPEPFIGCGHFGQAQSFWRDQGQALDWALS